MSECSERGEEGAMAGLKRDVVLIAYGSYDVDELPSAYSVEIRPTIRLA